MAAEQFKAICDRFGDRFDPQVLEETVAHWAPRVNAAAPAAAAAHIVDLAYGEHERHRLDLFPFEGSGAPVVLFVHGGGFTGGDKQGAPPFYANVGRYFAAHGMVGACMNYRRAPTGGWPAAAQDVEAAVAWLLDRADLYGGDPQQLIVLGQSAGACHVATWLFDPSLDNSSRGKIAAAILMSGYYQATEPLAAGPKAYFGEDSTLYAQRSVLTHARSVACPTLITSADHDPPYLRRQTRALAEALAQSPVAPKVVELAGHNHVSPLMSLQSDDDTTGQILRQFIQDAVRPAAPDARAPSPETSSPLPTVCGPGASAPAGCAG